MRTQPEKVRCTNCGTQLAETSTAGLTIRRSSLQATLTGHVHASLVCYRCGYQNNLSLSTLPPMGTTAA